jgi:flagellin
MYDSNIATTSFQGKLDTINSLSAQTGVTASASFYKSIDTTATFNGVAGTDFFVDDEIVMNGATIELGESLSDLVGNINAATSKTGITASAEGKNLILKGDNVQALEFYAAKTGGADDQQSLNKLLGLTTLVSFNTPADRSTTYGSIKLNSINNSPISIELKDTPTSAAHGLFEANVGAADYEVNSPSLGSGGQSISGLQVSTQASANNAISAIDKAIEGVGNMRAKMGAIQNRLEYTISNLTNVSTNTSASRSRILDTDYAAETSNLAKAQIISQAATAMLAQANESAQSVLALLK